MVIIATEQNKLQVIHLVPLAPVHHLRTPFCFHSLSMNRRSAKHIPIVVESGILKKESIASPKVTEVGSRDLITEARFSRGLGTVKEGGALVKVI